MITVKLKGPAKSCKQTSKNLELKLENKVYRGVSGNNQVYRPWVKTGPSK